MSHITKEEHLSAFLDGEAGSFEQQRLCDQLGCDDLMQRKLASFAMIGEAVRNQSQPKQTLASSSFLQGIQDAIADDVIVEQDLVEEAVIIPANVAKRRIFPKQVAGYAVAASLAAVTAISIQNYFKGGESPEMVATAPMIAPVRVNTAVMTPSIGTKLATPVVDTVVYQYPDAEMRGMINKYVAHHLQYASSTTSMPGVRAVSYSADF